MIPASSSPEPLQSNEKAYTDEEPVKDWKEPLERGQSSDLEDGNGMVIPSYDEKQKSIELNMNEKNNESRSQSQQPQRQQQNKEHIPLYVDSRDFADDIGKQKLDIPFLKEKSKACNDLMQDPNNKEGQKEDSLFETDSQKADEPPSSNTTNDFHHFSPKEMLKTRTFYIVFFALMVQALGLTVVANYYKVFALIFINDIAFLNAVVNTAAVSSMIFRFITGFLMDKFKVKTFIVMIISLKCILLSLWYFTPIANQWLYFIFTNLLIGLTTAIFVYFPVAALKLFGLKHFATNCGIILMGLAVSDLGSAPLVAYISMSYGFFWLFFIVASAMLFSLIFTIFFMPTKQIH